jgi:group I intron endonuclease
MYIDDKRGGIYRIRGPNDAIYLGSAKQFRSRTKTHISSLIRGDHVSKRMQADWNEYGADAFTFELVEYQDTVDLRLAREQELLTQLFVEYPRERIYNTSDTVGFYRSIGKRRNNARIRSDFERRMISRGIRRHLDKT